MTSEAQYLVRFDDICPTMNWGMWDRIEATLRKFGVKPILAVVPDNVDKALMPDPPRPDFWDRVRAWQSDGWVIALHGYQHRYVNQNSGVVGLGKKSEFAGLPPEVQRDKLVAAKRIFDHQRVKADCWVAPSHSFDLHTLQSLSEIGVDVVSDGLWRYPHTDARGMTWVPQQIWSMFKPRGPGVWTVCYHHNVWSEKTLALLQTQLVTYSPRVTSLHEVVKRYRGRRKTLMDECRAFGELMVRHRLLPKVARVFKR